jgi:hypothetical protein
MITDHLICPECGTYIINPEFRHQGITPSIAMMATTLVNNLGREYDHNDFKYKKTALPIYITRIRTILKRMNSPIKIVHNRANGKYRAVRCQPKSTSPTSGSSS